MRRNKSTLAGDSFGLLLDAMCNAFGGVMFIAVLVVIIAKNQPETLDSQEEERNRQQLLAELNQKIVSVNASLEALYQRQNSRKSLFPKSSKNEDNEKLISNYLVLKKKNKQLSSKLKRLLRQKEFSGHVTRKLEADRLKIRLKREEVEKHVKEMRKMYTSTAKSINDLESGLDKPLKAATATNIDFATLQDSEGLKPFFVILDNHKLFRINSYTRYPPGDNWSNDVRYSYEEQFKKYNFYPKANKGFHLQSIPLSKLHRYFDPIDKNKYFIDVFVRDDSFKEWFKLRNFFKNQRFSYDWSPVISGEPCSIYLVSEPVEHESY